MDQLVTNAFLRGCAKHRYHIKDVAHQLGVTPKRLYYLVETANPSWRLDEVLRLAKLFARHGSNELQEVIAQKLCN